MSEPIREDGWIIDPDTGEVVGVYGWMDKDQVENEQDLWRVQESIMRVDAKIIAEQVQMRAIIENCEKRIKALQRKREWIEMKFGPSAYRVAKELLPKGRKTYTSPYGEVPFRTTKDRLVVDDHALAVVWAKRMAPDSVKTVETVLVSKIPANVADGILGMEQFVPPGMHIEPGGEKASFSALKEKNEQSDQA
jgi:hypothetical protein